MKNNSDIKVMLKEAGILFVITLLSGILLGFVYELTKEPIRRQEEKAIQEACKTVFASADNFAEIEYVAETQMANALGEIGVKAGTVFEARDNSGQVLGYVIETTSTKAYKGNIVIYTGITMDGMINDIALKEINETPGLGMLAGEVLVPQFHEKQVESFTYTKVGSLSDSEIDAIASATITTAAVTDAVNGGLMIYKDITEGGGSDE